MRTIRISDEVWNKIAEQGKFGETEDDVLRRVFKIPGKSEAGPKKKRFATDRMTVKIQDNQLIISFVSGKSNRFDLPGKLDRDGIREVTREAMTYAEACGATEGQINAVRKKLTDAGYHIVK